MRKYLEKDCVTYLTHIVDKGANVKSIQNILIGRNHTEVFLKDLTGLSPTRIVEFRIDLVPGAAPMTKAPYLLEPSENARAVQGTTRTSEQKIDKDQIRVKEEDTSRQRSGRGTGFTNS
ncbi:hypothetical protein Tco_0020451 [Tanacetum coccineum]